LTRSHKELTQTQQSQMNQKYSLSESQLQKKRNRNSTLLLDQNSKRTLTESYPSSDDSTTVEEISKSTLRNNSIQIFITQTAHLQDAVKALQALKLISRKLQKIYLFKKVFIFSFVML
jgi:hypothetical protein